MSYTCKLPCDEVEGEDVMDNAPTPMGLGGNDIPISMQRKSAVSGKILDIVTNEVF